MEAGKSLQAESFQHFFGNKAFVSEETFPLTILTENVKFFWSQPFLAVLEIVE